MDALNLQHLRYFQAVAEVGTVRGAAQRLRLAQPTVSAQLRVFEQALGTPLFLRQGRRLVLTEAGRTVQRYADAVVRTEGELLEALRRGGGLPERLRVGVLDGIPKAVALRLLAPTLAHLPRLRLICREGPVERLTAALALGDLDVVLSDVPAPEPQRIRAWSHPLGACGVNLLAPRALADRAQGFPRSLEGAPFLLPTRGAALRVALDAWLAGLGVAPAVVGEFDDSALMLAFAAEGLGVVAVPAVGAGEQARAHGLVELGAAEGVQERFFALCAEQRVAHPAVRAFVRGAREHLAGG